jgi:uncharacterized protein YndB with AHSA1/START domain
MKEPITRTISINASPSKVWKHLTEPDLMKEWMGDEEMEIDILSDWKIGSSFIIKGFHHKPFENRGTILRFETERVFQYEYLSSMSGLEDAPESYTRISFYLAPKYGETELTVEAENFPTFEIYKHWEFYWNGTIHILKQVIESR